MTDDTLPTPESQQRISKTPESTTDTLKRIATTPMVDLLKGRVTGRRDLKTIIATAGLPATLSTLIENVVRGTRLWRRERLDVAKELISHFADGMHAGSSAEQLRDQFGDPVQTSKLIRQARLRCRPAWWHLCRYCLLGLGLLLLAYVGLAIRFFTSHPTISRNYLSELNEPIRRIPEDQRAWPLYREAMIARQPYPNLKKGQSDEQAEGWWQLDSNRVDRSSLAWKQLETYVEQNQAAIERIHEATTRPALGAIYEELLDVPPVSNRDNKILYFVSLKQAQELREFARLLTADSTMAVARHEGDRLAADLRSLIKIADHARGPFLIEDLVSTAIMQVTMIAIRDALEDAADLLTDRQLVDLAHQLGAFRGGGTIRFDDLRAEHMSMEDAIQRCYTDDGHGNGSFTLEGIKLLIQLRGAAWGALEETMKEPLQPTLIEAIAGPAVPLLTLDRRETKETIDHLFAEAHAARRGPLFSWQNDPLDEYFNRERNLNSLNQVRRGLSIPNQLFPALQQADMAAERLCQVRDGTLTAIALQLYQRRQGSWPTSLDQLVPQYLPELPLDRFTGQPLCYRVQDGSPIIYARGTDAQDDQGRHPDLEAAPEFHSRIFVKPRKELKPGEGYDWVLFPRPRRSQKEHEGINP